MDAGINSTFFIQILLFCMLFLVLLISVVSLFIKPAKRTIRASLVDVTNGHIIDISRSETSIGRAKACDFVISDISVSRFHAVLSKRSSGWMIFDTNSTSGIKVNGKKIEKKAYLNDGDNLLFGKSEYVFYSTAVTTRQQIVRKTKQPSENRTQYRKKPQYYNDEAVTYKNPKKSSSSQKTVNRSKSVSSDKHK
ncbi:MAG: FHA domain-containing protein [Clostridia bacterium]|nr:FHA domain-containing protein [Clostridia bacterium]